MRISVGLQASEFWPLICAPHLGPAKEETLFRRESINIFRAFALDGLFDKLREQW